MGQITTSQDPRAIKFSPARRTIKLSPYSSGVMCHSGDVKL